MRNKKVIIISIVIIAAIIAILFYNKSRSTLKSKSEILTSISVSVTKVEKQKLSTTRLMVGTITAHNDVAIISETSGKVTAVRAEVGQYVAAGGLIVQVDDELKKAAYISAETNNENNSIQYAQTLEITLTGMTAALVNQIKVLGQGAWRVMILDKQGNYWLMGLNGPVQVSASAAGLGKAGTDLNGTTLTFMSKETQPLVAVASSAALSLIV